MTDWFLILAVFILCVGNFRQHRMLQLQFQMIEKLRELEFEHIDVTKKFSSNVERRLKLVEQELDIKPKPG